jgi:hypothetical protein
MAAIAVSNLLPRLQQAAAVALEDLAPVLEHERPATPDGYWAAGVSGAGVDTRAAPDVAEED